MKIRITSLKGATVLAFIHLLLEIWRALLDFTYVLPEYSGQSKGGMAAIAALYTAIFAAWMLGLYAARRGSRTGAILSIVLGALFWLGVDISTILFYCPGGCENAVFDIATWIAILVGGAALYLLAKNLPGGNRAK